MCSCWVGNIWKCYSSFYSLSSLKQIGEMPRKNTFVCLSRETDLFLPSSLHFSYLHTEDMQSKANSNFQLTFTLKCATNMKLTPKKGPSFITIAYIVITKPRVQYRGHKWSGGQYYVLMFYSYMVITLLDNSRRVCGSCCINACSLTQ